MNRSFTLLVLTGLMLLTGCNSPTYINVPSDGRDMAINDPNQLTVIKIQWKSLTYLLQQSGLNGDIALRLPEGTTDAAAMMVAAKIEGFSVFPEGQTPSAEYQLIEVREISARGGKGRVDVIRPGKLRERELVEVHLRWDVVAGWVPERLHVRNIEVDRIDSQLLAAPSATPKKPAFETVEPASEPVPAPAVEEPFK